MSPKRWFHRLVAAFEPLSCEPGDGDEARARKAQFTLAMTAIIPAGLVWAVIYVAAGAVAAALAPLSYSVLTGANIVLLRRTRRFRRFQVSELAFILALPFVLQIALGGFVSGSAVVVWSILCPLYAVLFTSGREAVVWFGVFVAAVLVAGFVEPFLDADPLPSWLVTVFFVMNVAVPSGIVFGILVSFVSARDSLRSLQLAYLEQTVMLREREKLATLGTLAAGVAHELNNPAAAVRRAAEQLGASVEAVHRSGLQLSASRAGPASALATGPAVAAAAPLGVPLSPLEQSRREQELEDWLEDLGVAEPWELAPALVSTGHGPADLAELVDGLDGGDVAAVVTLVAQGQAATGLAGAIREGAQRISDIVSALRSYSYLDRGAVQVVDVTEGIESTLVLLRAKLHEMTVERDYAPDLPRIAVRGNELNQVWTNIIDNAIDATGGTGTLVLRTSMVDGRVVVDLEDDGPGMAPEVAARVFDPFFTTKPPGSGTGLGMNISYNIVVRQHGGELGVDSAPGRTRFRVVLPVGTTPAEGAPEAAPVEVAPEADGA
ncbi:MAG: hypothetical protein GEV08_19750 [Acidimicrobiia bacterium]|nr:hypothetical protein [Acidimicrobiia bacterium]